MYRTQSQDTSVEAELFLLQLLRQAGPARRFKQVRTLTATTRRMSWATMQRMQPNLSGARAALAFAELVYGKELARSLIPVGSPSTPSATFYLQNANPNWKETFMLSQDIVEAIMPVVAVLEELGVPYLIGGSVASSISGIPRSTNDADLVADLRPAQIEAFLEALQADYYLSEIALREALERKASFNLIHQATMLKIDIFIPKNEPFDQSELARSFRNPLIEGVETTLVNVASAEDMILRKLVWYQAGGSISEKQWLDVLGILKMQTTGLDFSYLDNWASSLGVSDLLTQVLQEAGL